MELDRLLAGALDQDGLDTDRIASIQDLLLATDGDTARKRRAAEALSELVERANDDYLVRQWAARDLALYPPPSNLERLALVLTNPSDDLNVRVNLLGAFESWDKDGAARATATLTIDDPLRRYL